MTMVEAGVVAEELGAALHPGPWLSSAVAATRALTRMVPGRMPPSLLTGIADGSTIATVGPLSGRASCRRERASLRGDDRSALPDAVAADVVLVLAEDRDGVRALRRRCVVGRACARRPDARGPDAQDVRCHARRCARAAARFAVGG